ncbi:hypothetical protein DERF_014777 [Dermatophagoides farinae]|uniref:Uncharacterized protein n=1 Tax=Dermatophagoides farinae TaxID=6954 RepID=A0A922HPW5_DERFA|nr:hypothetical protein DERF_014777 [Dermatophagoides farinae]
MTDQFSALQLTFNDPLSDRCIAIKSRSSSNIRPCIYLECVGGLRNKIHDDGLIFCGSQILNYSGGSFMADRIIAKCITFQFAINFFRPRPYDTNTLVEDITEFKKSYFLRQILFGGNNRRWFKFGPSPALVKQRTVTSYVVYGSSPSMMAIC